MAANANQGSDRKPGQRQMTAKQKQAKKRKKIIIFTIELLVIFVMLGALFILKDIGGNAQGPLMVKFDESDLEINSKAEENTSMKGFRNIALFGVDSTTGELTKNTRSDSIIIASINQDTGEVRLCSVYRDTYLNLSNDSYNKCNKAYADGGAKRAISMLNTNLDLDIKDFVTIGFGGLRDVIDGLGGVWIDVDEAELKHINSYQMTMAENLKCKYKTVEKTGLQLLDGLQATAYCRIRYTAGDDFKRAERQREVIQAIADEAKKADLATLTKVANDVSSNVYTSLELDEIIALLGEVSKYEIVDEAGFPNDNYRGTANLGSKGSSVLPLDLVKNVEWLHEFLFNDTEYTVSAEIASYSQVIRNDIAKYVDVKYPD